MRLLVCGGREFCDRTLLFDVLDRLHARKTITCVIEGGARGADLLARAWAEARGVAVAPFPADWSRKWGNPGSMRNAKMLREGKPDLVVAFPGGSGTRNMIMQAGLAGVPLYRVPASRLRETSADVSR